jgi:hypothetical protein
MLIDSGSGLAGWRQLEPACASCGGWSAAVTFTDLVDRLGGAVGVTTDCEPAGSGVQAGSPSGGAETGAGGAPLDPAAEPSITVVAAEVALLQARLDELQRQLVRLSGDGSSGAGP